jgi:PPOX class probable F420-dependent enzyme
MLASVSDREVPFAAEKYVSLETFKRDGTGVKTPVWAAPHEGGLVVFTAGDSFKVKRLRRDPRIRVAACDVRGIVRGEWRDGRGRIMERGEIARAHAALRAKYGFMMVMTDFFAGIAGRIPKREYLALTFD